MPVTTPSVDRGLAVRVLGAVLLALVPVVVVALSPWSSATGLLVLGMLPTLTAVPTGPRAMRVAAGGSVAAALLAVPVTNAGGWTPWLGTLLVMLLCLGTSVLSLHGVQAIGAAAIAFTAHVLVDPASMIGFLGDWAEPFGSALLIALGVALGCGWVFGVGWGLLRGVRLPATVQRATLPYGVLLALLCGAFTLDCVLRFPGTNAWWAVLTVAVILQPTHGETRRKLRGRIVGTVLGGTVAALAVMALPGQLVSVLLRVVASLAAVVLLLAGAPYWQ